MHGEVYIAAAGLTKVDLTGRIYTSVFDLFAEAYRRALQDSEVREFDAVQIGIMDSEEFENRANIAAKIVDRIGLTGIPAVRSETASSTGAAAFHEGCYKVASGQFDSVLVLAGERMKMVTTEMATTIMSKTVDPVERGFGFTMPGLIALLTQAWMRERGLQGPAVANALARLMLRAHTLGAENPRAAFYGKSETLDAYFTSAVNLPVATPLTRKDCSPICDGAAAVILTSKPQAVRVAGLGSATESSSILDRESLSTLGATRLAAQRAYARAGIARPREVEGLVIEVHDAFNSLLPMDLADLDLVDPDDALGALIGDPGHEPMDPFAHPKTGPRGSLPTNLSGGLKARGHPVGGTGLFQIAETYLQITGRFPSERAQVEDARVGLGHSIGGPGNNVYVTLIERENNPRKRDSVAPPRLRYESSEGRPQREPVRSEGRAIVEAATTIFVAPEGIPSPVHAALLSIDGRRVFAKLDRAPGEGDEPEQVLAGQKVDLLVKDDGDTYFQIPRPGVFNLSRLVDSVRRRIAAS
jgi:acetyl-CoA acetyltransferase